MTNKKMKNIKKDESSSKTLKEKTERKTKARNISVRKKQSEDLEELARTWDEDLCE